LHSPLRPLIGIAHLLLGGTACVLLGGAAWSQGSGASESGFVLTQSMVGAGGVSLSSFANEAQASAGQFGVGPPATSGTYELRTGVTWSAESLTSNAPIVVGPRPAYGDKDGNENVLLFGTNFLAPGAGGVANTNLEMANGFGTVVNIGANSFVRGVTPNGESLLDNPITNSPVTVSNLNGSATAEDSYHYIPALLQGSAHARIGRDLTFFVQWEPNGPYTIVFGQNVKATGFPVFPYDGQLEVLLGINFLIFINIANADGWDSLTIPIPDEPSLIGASVDFQTLAFDDLSLSAGSFSNLLTIDLLP